MDAAAYIDDLERHGTIDHSVAFEIKRRLCDPWRPIAEFKMPDVPNGYQRHRMLFQVKPGHPANPTLVCEGYARLWRAPQHGNSMVRFYDASGRWLINSVEYFMPLPEPKEP